MSRSLRPLAIVSILFASSAAVRADAPAELDALLAEAWEYRLDEFPTFATTVGDGRANAHLADVSLAANERRAEKYREFQARLHEIDRDALETRDRIDYDMFARELETSLAEHDFGGHLIPITNREGFHIDFPRVTQDAPFETVGDYENYIQRLRAFPQYVAQHIELMREGIETGMVLPAISVDGYEDVLNPQIVDDPRASQLYEPLEDFPDRIGEEQQARIKAEVGEAILTYCNPAYQSFFDFLKNEYHPACRGGIAASALPNGRAYYRHRVRLYTTLDLTPEQVHETGQREVQRIKGEMQEIIRRVDFDGDFATFLEFLRTDPQFVASDKQELLERTASVCKKMDGELPRLFRKLPRTPYGLKEIPAFIAPKTTSAYYQPPKGDGSRAGFYFVNTYDLPSRPLHEVEALSLHEAVPGHHLQLALQQELDLRPIRRFSGVTAFIEGWALYSERLGIEVGFYDDPYSDFGRLTFENWRACRLVVDTGIHYLGWSRQQAIDFMAANTGLSMHNIRAEVDRYIAWPGQALAYKTGELKIRELRAKAERRLGDSFDVREFHDVVLRNGAVPLAVLDEEVTRWLGGRD